MAKAIPSDPHRMGLLSPATDGHDLMASSRVKLRDIWALAWTTALAFTSRRYRGANRRWIVEAQIGWAVAAFPIYWTVVIKAWMTGTGYSNGTDIVVTIIDRRRNGFLNVKSLAMLVVALGVLVILIVGVADGQQWSSAAFAALLIVAIAIVISAVVEVFRGIVATGGKPHSRGAAVRRLDPRWTIEGLAQRPGTSGGIDFARQMLMELGTVGDGVLTVARDAYVRRAYLALKFEPTPENPDVLYRTI